jgi:hypothetical protein
MYLLNAQGVRVVAAAGDSDGGGRLDLASESGVVVASVSSIKDKGAGMTLSNSAGKRAFMVGALPQGGLLNIMNTAGNKILIAGSDESGRGGAFSIKNGRGVQVLNAGTGENENGIVTVWDADGRKFRTIAPVDALLGE